MLVSIIIPIYNVSDFIESCLTSVFNQTYKNIEVILVDDCSPDDSIDKAKAIIASFPGKGEVKIVVHKKNKGLSGARNTGVQHATGEYLYFLDSDDKIAVDAIESLVNAGLDSKPDFVIGNFKPFGASLYDFPNLKMGNIYITGNESIFDLFLKEQWYPMAWNKLVKREFLIENRLYFYEGIYHEDILWSFQLAQVAGSMVSSSDITYNYRIRENSIMGSKSLKHYEDMIFCCREIKDSLGFKRSKLCRIYLETFLIMIIYDMYLNRQKRLDISNVMDQIKSDFNFSVKFPRSKREFLNLLKMPVFLLPSGLSYYYLKIFHFILKK